MKQIVDCKRSDQSFNVGDQVFLKVKRFLRHSFSTTPQSKLSPKYFWPFPITEKVGRVAYKLQLPEGVEIHSVFHMFLLKKLVESTATVSTDLLPVDEDVEVEVEPQAI